MTWQASPWHGFPEGKDPVTGKPIDNN